MARTNEPSYSSLVYQTLKAAEHPLTLREIIEAVERRRPITTRNLKSTLRAALNQGSQLIQVGGGRYWYLPYCLRGSVVRIFLAEKKPARQPIALAWDVLLALWPSFFDIQSRKTTRPVQVRFPSGDEVTLTLDHSDYKWMIPPAEPLQSYLVNQRAGAGESLLIRILDAEAGQVEAWFESRTRRPREAIAARNHEIADAACTFIRGRRESGVAIWEIATALLARGLYRADTAPDPLMTVLRADPRVDFGQPGPLAGLFPEETGISITVRKLPDPASLTIPADAIYQLKVTLRGTNPPIWRRLLVPAGTRLSTLHHLLQIAMGWMNEHLHMFRAGRRSIGEPSPEDWTEVEDESEIRLSDVAARARSRLTYKYDFGDSWEHQILVEKILSPNPKVRVPACIAGSRACPPEDVGGVWGYARFLAIMAHPANEEYGTAREWVGGEFDPEAFDLRAVNDQLREVQVL